MRHRPVLVIGAAGQLGCALTEELKRACHPVVEAVHRDAQRGQRSVDLSDIQGISVLLEETDPRWILIAGAFCNVDLCEREQQRCHEVNAQGPKVIAEWGREHGTTVVYYSTDHVFDGTTPIVAESDPVHPLNAYAASKVEGERALRELLLEEHLILRASGLYGPDTNRRNFVIRLLDRLKAGETVRVPSDQWGSPTYTEDLARATRFLLEQGFRGTYHATGPDFLPRSEFARRICSAFNLDGRGILPTPTEELRQPARRPLHVLLKTDKLSHTGAPAFRSIEQGLAALRGMILQGVV